MKYFALIVEDDPAIGDLFSMVLRRSEYFTQVVADGNEALTWLRRVAPDLVILDLNLPGVNGVDILKAIREDENLQGVQVIVITANTQRTYDVQDIADLVLVKPVVMGQLGDLATRFQYEHIYPANFGKFQRAQTSQLPKPVRATGTAL